jgi:CheY-like chemotaxis protein
MPPRDPVGVDVLIAEEDAQVRAALRTLLEGEGYRCAEADSVQSAVDLARQNPPRCVLVDLGIPDKGSGVVRTLRADPRTRGARIHCLTGRADSATRLLADQAGFEKVLTKPIDAEQLLAVVAEEFRAPLPVVASGLTPRQAEDLLDWLEEHGVYADEVTFEDGRGFTVRYVRPPR